MYSDFRVWGSVGSRPLQTIISYHSTTGPYISKVSFLVKLLSLAITISHYDVYLTIDIYFYFHVKLSSFRSSTLCFLTYLHFSVSARCSSFVETLLVSWTSGRSLWLLVAVGDQSRSCDQLAIDHMQDGQRLVRAGTTTATRCPPVRWVWYVRLD